MEYIAPINGDQTNPDRPYIDGDPSVAQAGSIPSARFFNLLMNEGRNLVEGAGLTLDPQDDAQWLQAVAALIEQGAPRWLVMEETSVLTIPPSTATTLTNLSLSSSNLIDTVATTSGFIVGPQDAGVWSITVRGNVYSGIRERLALFVGGTNAIHQFLDGTAQIPTTALVYPINAGEEVELRFTHSDTVARDTTGWNLITAARISGL